MHPFDKKILKVPNFPKEGVNFLDISPLLKESLSLVITELGKGINWSNIDYVVGIESRGFILGSAMAIKYNKGFIPIRKKGKLPPPVLSEEYDLEYGKDKIEMAPNSLKKNVVLVDDVLATGGTLKAAIKLCQKANYDIKAISVLINLKFLNTFERDEEIPLFSTINYEA